MLGIAGFVLCPILPHIAGWILANQSLAAIEASGGWLTGEGMAKAGKVLSIVGLALYGIGIIVGLVFLVTLVVGAGVASV